MNGTKISMNSAALQRGFTLIELLMTVTIMVAVVALGVNSVGGLRSSLGLQSASAELIGQFDLARQTARTKHRKVEVRFYANASAAMPDYRSIRMFLISADGLEVTPLQQAFALPDSIGICADQTFSSLLSAGDKSGVDARGSYCGFSFLPDGTVDVAGGSLPTLTLVPVPAKAVGPGKLPPNFATLQIDPRTGRTKFFRP
jgi:uncharacterized protein (TIGR02596 family)